MWKIACVALLALAGSAARVQAQVESSADSASTAPARDPGLLTRDDFHAAEGESLYGVLRRLRRAWVTWDARFGHPTVYVDSVPRGMPSVLENIPAAAVQWVQFSDAREARIRFGRRHPYGVIYVSTQSAPSAASPPVPPQPAFASRTGLAVSTNGVLPLGGDHYFAGRSRGPGLEVALLVPLRPGTAWTVGLSWSAIEWDASDSWHLPPAPGEDGGLLSATAGVKRHMGGSLRYAPYFETSVGVFRAARGNSDNLGIGAVGGLGLDARLNDSFTAFSTASLSVIRFPHNDAGSFWRLQVGLITYFAGPASRAAPAD